MKNAVSFFTQRDQRKVSNDSSNAAELLKTAEPVRKRDGSSVTHATYNTSSEDSGLPHDFDSELTFSDDDEDDDHDLTNPGSTASMSRTSPVLFNAPYDDEVYPRRTPATRLEISKSQIDETVNYGSMSMTSPWGNQLHAKFAKEKRHKRTSSLPVSPPRPSPHSVTDFDVRRMQLTKEKSHRRVNSLPESPPRPTTRHPLTKERGHRRVASVPDSQLKPSHYSDGSGHDVRKSTHRRGTWSEPPIKNKHRHEDKRISRSLKQCGHRRNASSSCTYENSNDLESLKAALRIRCQRFGPHDPMVGQAWNHIGNYHFRAREYDRAIEAYTEALECDQNADGVIDYTHLAAALGNLGTVYWTTGDIGKSIDSLENSLNMHIFAERAKGKDPEASLAVASCLYQIGLAMSLRQDYHNAMKDLAHSRQIREAVLGPTHVDVARTVDAMGKVHMFLGELDEAMHCHQQALDMKKAAAGHRHDPAIVSSLMNIAAVHRARYEYDDAISMYLQAQQMQKKELAKCKIDPKQGRPNEIRVAREAGETLQILEELYRLKGDLAASTRSFKEALIFFREAGLKEDDPKIVSLKWSRGNDSKSFRRIPIDNCEHPKSETAEENANLY